MATAKHIEDFLKKDKVNVGKKERIVSGISGGALLISGIADATDEDDSKIKSAVKIISGGYMLYRAITGYCPVRNAIGLDTVDIPAVLEISERMTVSRPVAEVYQAWRKLENLPKFMKHLSEVKQLTSKKSHWEAKVPGGIGKIKWDAEILFEKENEVLSWVSVPGSPVENSGQVFFAENAEGNTVLKATISYRPPAGEAGKTIAKILNHVFGNLIRQDLKEFKKVIESGKLEEKVNA